MANESTAQPPTPELVGVGSKDLLDALLDCKMNLLHAINSIHEEELCDDDLNLYNTLIKHADVCTLMDYKPNTQPQSESGADSESPRTTGSALWGFQCDTCGIRSGHAFVGTKSQALQIAPTCCAFVVMTPVQIGEAPVWPNNAICVKPKEGK